MMQYKSYLQGQSETKFCSFYNYGLVNVCMHAGVCVCV